MRNRLNFFCNLKREVIDTVESNCISNIGKNAIVDSALRDYFKKKGWKIKKKQGVDLIESKKKI